VKLLLLLALAAKPNPYLAQAKVFFQGGDYKQCLKRVDQAQKWDSSEAEQAEVALYSGLCHFQLRQTKEAETDFALALRIDPRLTLPPLTSPKAVSLFESLRPKEEPAATTATAPPPKEEPRPPPPAAEPTATPTPEPHAEPAPAPAVTASSHVPITPFIVAGLGVIAAGVGVFFGVSAVSSDNQARMATFQSDAISLRHSAEGSAAAADITYAFAGVALATAVILFFVMR
jgi:hypothetical protein